MTRCTLHRGRPAAWQCDGCRRGLCEDCAAPDPRLRTLVRCVACGGVGRAILVEPARPPYWRLVPELLGAVFSPNGLLALLVTGLGLWILRSIPIPGPVGLLLFAVRVGLLAAFFATVVRHAAGGHLALPAVHDFRDTDEGWFGPLLALLMGLIVATLPLLGWLVSQGALDPFREGGPLMLEPVSLLLLALTVTWLPGALVVAAITCSVPAVVNPLRVVALIRLIPRDYAITTGVVAVLVLVQVYLVPELARVPPFRGIPVLSGLLFEVVGLVIPALLALVLGWLVWQNAPALGWDDPTRSRIPAVPGAVPRGTLRAPERDRGPIEVGPADAPWPAPDDGFFGSVWDERDLPAPPPGVRPVGPRDPLEDGIPLAPPDPTAPHPAPPAPLAPPRPRPRPPQPWPPRPTAAPPAPAPDPAGDEPEWVELGTDDDGR